VTINGLIGGDRSAPRKVGLCLGVSVVILSVSLKAQAADMPTDTSAPPVFTEASSSTNPITDYFLHWYDRVHEAQATQPHWMTPIATVTPRLEQEIRFDTQFQQLGSGAQITNIDGGKGLELIPTTMNEILINAPAYEERTVKSPAYGFADWNFLTIKQRIVSAPEDKGNYIFSAFLGVQAPMRNSPFTNKSWVITPTLAGGKGWGDFDIQATVGMPIPTTHEATIGKSLVTNVALQYHFMEYFWPELEFNDTYWLDGERGHRNQLFITPGIVFGRFALGNGLKGIIGVGYQIALDPQPIVLEPLTPTYDHAVVLTSRLAF
jgi:hypothetical protein